MKIEERWDRLDWVWLAGLTVVATVVRAIRLGTPKALIFDEFYYVPDACRYVTRIAEICGPRELTWMHPPLGKWAIGMGMEILGPTRYGWRLFPLVAGVLTVVLLYVLGRALFATRVSAIVAAGFLTFDFMHFLHSRLATLDVFVTLWVTAGALLVALDREHEGGGWLRPWRFGAGVCFGAAVATKWSAGLLLLGAIVVCVVVDRAGRKDENVRRGAAVATLIGLVLIPLVVYLASYAGRFDGPLLQAPWAEGSWGSMWLDRQERMFEYHTSGRAAISESVLAHPSASPAWSWLLLKRPMAYFFEVSSDRYREIMAMGHVLLWPLGIAVLGWLTARSVRIRSAAHPYVLILTLFAFAYVPWFVLTGSGQDPYAYYLLPGLPFLYLGFGAAAEGMWKAWWGRTAVAVVAVAAVALWAFYLPLLTAKAVTVPEWRQRILFHDCALFEGPSLARVLESADPELPLEGLGRPPRPSDRLFPTGTRATGWCWI